jgi:hypothetical protein
VTSLPRRRFLLGTAGLIGGGVLAACGDDGDGQTVDPGGAAATAGAGIVGLVPSIPDGFRAPSPLVHGVEQRVAYALLGESDILREAAPDTVDLRVLFEGEEVAGGAIERRDGGVPTPYYPVWFTPPGAGTYTTVVGDASAEPALRHDFLVLEPGDTAIPQPGDVLPAITTGTFDDPGGVDPLCTRADPCPFHRIDLVDALAAGDRPTVVSIATPGFCQTAICGPVVDLLVDEAGDRTDLHVIHAEVYVDPLGGGGPLGFGDTTEIVAGYELPFEPVLYVCAADGTIVRRLDAVYDRSELAEAIALVTV